VKRPPPPPSTCFSRASQGEVCSPFRMRCTSSSMPQIHLFCHTPPPSECGTYKTVKALSLDKSPYAFQVVPFLLGSGSMNFFFFFTFVTGPRRSLSLKLSDTRVYGPCFEAASVECTDLASSLMRGPCKASNPASVMATTSQILLV